MSDKYSSPRFFCAHPTKESRRKLRKMKYKILLALLILISFVSVGKAEIISGTHGIEGRSIITWKFNTETGVLNLEGTGYILGNYFTKNSTEDWLKYRNDIKKVIIGDSILSIGSYAFYGCVNLEEVVTPETEFGKIKDEIGWSIGSGAFNGCTSLKSFTFPKGIVYVGSSFQNCTSLESVTIRGNLFSLGSDYSYSFEGSTNFKKVYIEDLNKYASAFWEFVDRYPCGVFYYADSVFIEGKYTTDVVIPEGVTHLSGGLFAFAKTIKSVKLPSTIKEIGVGAFSFSGIETITIPTNNLSEIYGGAFFSCSSLREVHIDDVYAWSNADLSKCHLYGRDLDASPLTANEKVRLYVNGNEVGGSLVLNSEVGAYAFKNCKYITSVKFLNNAADGQVNVSIGDGAFQGCTRIKAINIPANDDANKNRYNFGKNAFKGCASLEKIEIPTSNSLTLGDSAFADCGNVYLSLDAATIGKQEATINQCPFSGCSGEEAFINNNGNLLNSILEGTAFQYIVLGDSVKNIRGPVFKDYISLYNIRLPESLETIGANAFDGCTELRQIFLPENVTIDDYAFANCANLEEINVWGNGTLKSVGANIIGNTALYNNAPNGGIYIGDWLVAYKKDEYKVDVYVPAGIKGIASSVFANDTLLHSIYLSEVKYINEGAFSVCSNLYNIMLGGLTIEYIGDYAFAYCTNLSDPRIMVSAKEIGDRAFSGCSSLPSIDCFNLEKLGRYAFERCTSVQVVNSLGNITEIPDNAFYRFSNLIRCEIPATVKTIGSYAFRDCTSLKKITIPTSVDSIDTHAFEGNSALDTVIIASHKIYLGGKVFNSCDSLKAVYILSDSVPDCMTSQQQRPFLTGTPRTPAPRGTLYVPIGCKDKYPERITMDFAEVVEMDMTALRQATGIATPAIDDASVAISVENGKIIISGCNEGETISIYSMDGKLLKHTTADNNEEELSIDNLSGTIVVRIGAKAYKVKL